MKLFYSILLILLSFNLSAQVDSKRPDGQYPFKIYFPKGYNASVDTTFPVIFFLHGRSLCGTSLDKVDDYGPIYEINRGMSVPFIVVAPQTPCGKMWDPNLLNKLVDYVIGQYKVDTTRMYVWGMSMGGYGTFYFTGKFASRFAAAIAMCGGGNVADAPNLVNLPLWVIHGTADRIVPISESEKMVNAIHNAGGDDVIFTKVPGWDHGAPARCFREKEKYDWLLEHKKLYAGS